jgi:hypothetical protein
MAKFYGGIRRTIPDCNHVVVHLLELPLSDIERVRRGVELVGLEALIAEGNLERLVVLLNTRISVSEPILS